MEHVEDRGNNVDVFTTDIELYLSQFCEEQKISDMKDESQNVWNAALMYIRMHAFNAPGCLKSKTLVNTTGAFTGGVSNYNAYNYELINKICDYYIYLCMMYDKEVSAVGFSLLTGINQDTLIAWKDGENKLSTTCSEISRKISQFREESLSAKLATAKRNPVGILAILNRHYGWNLPGVSREQSNKQALTAAELPQLKPCEYSDNNALSDTKSNGNTADTIGTI